MASLQLPVEYPQLIDLQSCDPHMSYTRVQVVCLDVKIAHTGHGLIDNMSGTPKDTCQ